MTKQPVNEELLNSVRDLVASGDSGACRVVALLDQFAEHLKEEALGMPAAQLDGYRTSVLMARRFITWVSPKPHAEQQFRNSYIPEK